MNMSNRLLHKVANSIFGVLLTALTPSTIKDGYLDKHPWSGAPCASDVTNRRRKMSLESHKRRVGGQPPTADSISIDEPIYHSIEEEAAAAASSLTNSAVYVALTKQSFLAELIDGPAGFHGK